MPDSAVQYYAGEAPLSRLWCWGVRGGAVVLVTGGSAGHRLQKLVVPCGHDIVRQRPPHAHTLLLVNQEAVVLHLDVRLQLGLDVLELGQGVVGLLELYLQILDALLKLLDLVSEFAVRLVVAGLHLRPLQVVCCNLLPPDPRLIKTFMRVQHEKSGISQGSKSCDVEAGY